MRKTIGKAMAATTSLALALSMAACGSSSENAEEATKVGGTITIWTWEQPGKAFEAAAKGFQLIFLQKQQLRLRKYQTSLMKI